MHSGNCTGKAQVADPVLNKPFKSTIKKAYTISAADDVTAHIAAGGSASSYSMDKHIGALRNNGLAWVMAGWERMRQLETSVLAGYKDAGTLRAFDPTFQRRAANELERLFNTAAQPEADDAEAGSNEELEAFSDHSEEDSEDEGWAADRGLDVVQTALRTKLRNQPTRQANKWEAFKELNNIDSDAPESDRDAAESDISEHGSRDDYASTPPATDDEDS